MAWQAPKINWTPADPAGAADFNRWEGNSEYLKIEQDKLKSGETKAGDSKKLNGQLPAYYATKASVEETKEDLSHGVGEFNSKLEFLSARAWVIDLLSLATAGTGSTDTSYPAISSLAPVLDWQAAFLYSTGATKKIYLKAILRNASNSGISYAGLFNLTRGIMLGEAVTSGEPWQLGTSGAISPSNLATGDLLGLAFKTTGGGDPRTYVRRAYLLII